MLFEENIGAGVHYLSIPEHPYYQQTFGWGGKSWGSMMNDPGMGGTPYGSERMRPQCGADFCYDPNDPQGTRAGEIAPFTLLLL